MDKYDDLDKLPVVKPFTAEARIETLSNPPFPAPKAGASRVICPVLRTIYDRSDAETRELVLEAIWMAKRMARTIHAL